MKPNMETEVVVVGAGPGGYAAAFYAADKGKKVVLVEMEKKLGGVCLNRGCIPSKALLHATKLPHEVELSAARGIEFSKPKVNLDKLRAWKSGILDKLAGGIASVAKMRGVEVVYGRGTFEDSHTLRIESESGQKFLRFQKAILAVGSRPAMPKAFDLGNPRVMTSTEALDIEDVPDDLLVVGGGYIGMELGTVYASLGSKVTVVEAMGSLLGGADADLARPVVKYAEKNFKEVRLNCKVSKMSTAGKQIKVAMEFDGKKVEELYDRVLVSVGRTPNTADLGLKSTKVTLDDKGFVKIDKHQQTTDPNIFAIGDVAGGLMLAHKASREARVAVDNITGEPSSFENVVIPAVVFTEPEVAWCGLTENEARAKGIEIKTARFPWGASGRALATDKTDGVTKFIVDPHTERVLGVGIAGYGAGDMISEGVLAIEMGATIKDIALSVHPHPTYSETLMEGAEAFYGHATHVFTPKRNP